MSSTTPAAAVAAATPTRALIPATDLNYKDVRGAFITLRTGVTTSSADLAQKIHEVAQKIQLHSTSTIPDPNAFALYYFLDGFLEGVRPQLAVSESETLRKIKDCLEAAFANFSNAAGEADKKELASQAQSGNASAAAAAAQVPSATAKAKSEAEAKAAASTNTKAPPSSIVEFKCLYEGAPPIPCDRIDEATVERALLEKPNGTYVVVRLPPIPGFRVEESQYERGHKIFFVFDQQIETFVIGIHWKNDDPHVVQNGRKLGAVDSYCRVDKGKVTYSGFGFVTYHDDSLEKFITQRTDLKLRLDV